MTECAPTLVARIAQPLSEAEARRLGPLQLAFIGDTIYDLAVRTRMLLERGTKNGELHRRSVAYVRADAQAEALAKIAPLLTSAEADVARRGRNVKHAHSAKNAQPGSYEKATGLEALMGYLYLSGQDERLRALLDAVMQPEE